MSKIKAISRTSKITKPVEVFTPVITFDAHNEGVSFEDDEDTIAELEWQVNTLETCSTRELYGFSGSGLNRVPKEKRIEGIKAALGELTYISGDAKRGANKGFITYIFTLINEEDCNYIKEALEDGELFTLVKSFVNTNSGNVNDLYISNGGGK